MDEITYKGIVLGLHNDIIVCTLSENVYGLYRYATDANVNTYLLLWRIRDGVKPFTLLEPPERLYWKPETYADWCDWQNPLKVSRRIRDRKMDDGGSTWDTI